jgi:DNA end-binding protein Ku
VLRSASEVRDTKDYFDDVPDVKVERNTLKLAEPALERKEAIFVDPYEEAVVEVLKRKQAGIAPAKSKASQPARSVVNLLDA